MVGHTGDLQATINAVEVVDECLGRLEAAVTEMGGIALITSDHGNAENMIDGAGGPNTAHTNDEVPLIITIPGANLRNDSALCDVAPTVLALLHIPKPAEMTGTSIIIGSAR
jgi:2,3-bisphosphoglycerate-independent phosphoglycerate mutase